jgi:hypothetical protein
VALGGIPAEIVGLQARRRRWRACSVQALGGFASPAGLSANKPEKAIPRKIEIMPALTAFIANKAS